MNLTPKRQQILDTLTRSGTALSARSISDQLPKVNQATVYRSLDYLESADLVRKFTPRGSEALYEIALDNHHHAVCRKCEQIIHIQAPDEKILQLLNLDKNFQAESLEIIVKGRHHTHPSSR